MQSTMQSTGTPRRRVGLIVGIVLGAIILLAVVGYGGAVIVTNQQVAQAQIQANGKAVTGVTSIALENYAFSPAHVQVPVGTTITWTNMDTAPHSVTFSSGLTVDSGLFAQGRTFSYTFTQPGDYTYRCSVHPAMIGKVTVVPAGH